MQLRLHTVGSYGEMCVESLGTRLATFSNARS